MNALEYPLEALAFNYLRYGFSTVVNNIWTWLAVITAAISFWRITASSSPGILKNEPNGSATPPKIENRLPQNVAAEVAEARQAEHVFSSSKLCTALKLEREGRTKGKFVLYLNEDEYEESRGIEFSEIDDDKVVKENKCFSSLYKNREKSQGYEIDLTDDDSVVKGSREFVSLQEKCRASEGGDDGDNGGAVVNKEFRWWSHGCGWERLMVTRKGDTGWYNYQDRTVFDGSVVRLWDSGRRLRFATAAALVAQDGATW